METQLSEPAVPPTPAIDPEREAVMADAVGVALLVVLDRLNPAERLAFVLHDLFAVSFEEIGNILGKSTMATRQLASRARRRVQGAPADPEVEVRGKRKLISSFLNALRAGDVPALVAVLDPEFVIHIDKFSTPDGEPRVIHGPETWANQAVVFSKGAKFVQPVWVDGDPGIVFAPHGHLTRVLRLTFAGDRIGAIEIIGDPERLKEMDLAVFHE
jgi:RNA polymerase sigma-70 factor (ECF subfamily)